MKKVELIRRVEVALGAPVINIEVDIEQVEVIIKDCLEEYRDYLCCCEECISNREIYGILEFRELVTAKVGIQLWKNLCKFVGTKPDGFSHYLDGIYAHHMNELTRIRNNMYE